MDIATVIEALSIPPTAEVSQRVPKKLLLENGAPTASDKRQINEGIEVIKWHATLRPNTINVPIFRDELREYLEIAVLSLSLRPLANKLRLTELLHRAVPYPLLLVTQQAEQISLSLAHLKNSQGNADKMVLEEKPIHAALNLNEGVTASFLSSLEISQQRNSDLYSFYDHWKESFEAYLAAAHTDSFSPAPTPETATLRRKALSDSESLNRQIALLRSAAAKEKQLNRRVEINLQINDLEKQLASAAIHF